MTRPKSLGDARYQSDGAKKIERGPLRRAGVEGGEMRKRFVRLTMALGAMVVALGYQQSQRPEKPKPAAAPAGRRAR